MINDAEVSSPDQPKLRIVAPALAKLVKLLRYIANDPALADRATFLSDSVAVTDTDISFINEAQDESQEWALAQVQFTQASGSMRYDLTGGNPKADGTRGLQLPSGGGMFEIRGAWNIRKFRVICETGQTAAFTVMLYKTAVWSSGALREVA